VNGAAWPAASSRSTFWLATLLLAGLVLLRALPFVWWEDVHFDSDQAIVGLMAKHISEGRAFPLFFYGQNYMLAIEAYLAAPLMLLAGGSTVTLLKAPLVAINVTIVVLLLRILIRDARLSPLMAALATLPLALPSAGVAARVTEANGGNVEPWLYVLLLWVARERPWWLGTLLGVGMLHREFTAYGAVALLVMDAFGALRRSGAKARLGTLARRWTVVAVAMIAVRGVASALQPFASALGPGTRGDDPFLVGPTADYVGSRVCFEPSAWPSRVADLVWDHLPRLVGGRPAPLQDYGVLTSVWSGFDGLSTWVGVITMIGLASGAWRWLSDRRRGSDCATSPGGPNVGGYLLLLGLISTVVYAFGTCSDITVHTMRYNLLGLGIPLGALVMALKTWTAPTVRAALGAAVAFWCAVNAFDVLALAREQMVAPPLSQRRLLAVELEQRGVAVAWSRYWNAYHLTFLTQERVRVSANDFPRIREYFEEAARTAAPTITEVRCEPGTLLGSSKAYLCRE
jgi:hypothetical protein